MKYFNVLLVGMLLFSSFGVWGCTHQKTGAISAKIQELESRYAKLEEDYRVLQVTHEQSRKRLSQAETQRALLEKQKTELLTQNANLTTQMETAVSEREELRKQVAQRAAERDAAQAHLMQFSKDLQALVGRVESAVNTSVPSGNLTIIPASRRTE
jgi:outer membrane murein-binding lipoprotein Lpp